MVSYAPRLVARWAQTSLSRMPILPVLIPLLGALFLWGFRQNKERVLWLAFVSVALVLWLACLALGSWLPASLRLSAWRPTDLFFSTLELQLDQIGWAAAMAAATLMLSVALTAAARPGASAGESRALMLAYVGMAMAAILAGNLLTVAVTWAMADSLALLYLLRASKSPQAMPGVIARYAINLASILLVAAAAPISARQDTTGAAIAVLPLVAAALLRLGLFPLHIALPPIAGVRRGLGSLLRLLPPVMALVVLARHLDGQTTGTLHAAILLAGILGAGIGALRWLLHTDPVEARPFLVLGLSAVAVLAAGGSSQAAAQAVTALATLLPLVGGLVSLYVPHTPWHRAFPLAAGLVLIGPPWTPAHRLLAEAVRQVPIQPLDGTGLILASLTLVFLAAGVSRLARLPLRPWPSGEDLVRSAYALGLSLPLLAALILGVRLGPEATTMSGLSWMVMMLLSGLTVWMFRDSAILASSRWRSSLPARLDPTGLYDRLWAAYRVLLRGVRLVGRIWEGEAGLLWVIVVVVVVHLAWGGSSP